jgi:prevent-host-death family protein
MKFVSVRDLRGKSAEVWRALDEEGELVVTSNGKPIAIVSATDETHFEQALGELRQARALRAVKQLHEQSLRHGRDKLTAKAVEAEVAVVRNRRSR